MLFSHLYSGVTHIWFNTYWAEIINGYILYVFYCTLIKIFQQLFYPITAILPTENDNEDDS